MSSLVTAGGGGGAGILELTVTDELKIKIDQRASSKLVEAQSEQKQKKEGNEFLCILVPVCFIFYNRERVPVCVHVYMYIIWEN